MTTLIQAEFDVSLQLGSGPTKAIHLLEPGGWRVSGVAVHVWREPSSNPAVHLLQDRKTGPVVSGDQFDIQTNH